MQLQLSERQQSTIAAAITILSAVVILLGLHSSLRAARPRPRPTPCRFTASTA